MHTPQALLDESPRVYADRVGRGYAAERQAAHKKQLGQYFTPLDVAAFMADLHTPQGRARTRILDPGAGAGILSCALCERLAQSLHPPTEIDLWAYELDADLASHLDAVLLHTRQWLAARNITLRFVISREDFVLTYASVLAPALRLFADEHAEPELFDVVIANPPYLKLPKSDPRARAASAVVYGQPNLYALFMAVAARLLKPGGELLVISPRSYTAGAYFQRFREYFLTYMRPEYLHLFDSRRDAFAENEVLQENIILRARRRGEWDKATEATVLVSHSRGRADLQQCEVRALPLSMVWDDASPAKMLHIPSLDAEDMLQLVRSWRGSLERYGLEISTGPVVPFRARSLLAQAEASGESYAPLLWMQHIQPMRVVWPTAARGKPHYIVISPESRPLLIADKHYVFLRRFSAKEQKRRLIAAPYLPGTWDAHYLGLENHLNYIHRPGGDLSAVEVYGLALLFNSYLLDAYFRTFNGSTQVNATEIRALPLPPWEQIVALGERALNSLDPAGEIEGLIDAMLSPQEIPVEAVVYG